MRLAAVIFDLDGTLADGGHDFAGIKARLGLPAALPLTEGLGTLPPGRREAAWAAVEAWEQELAEVAVPMPGAVELLTELDRHGVRRGVLTRNTRATALRTLDVTRLATFFDPADVVGRQEAPAKPDPAGVRLLLGRWGVEAPTAVMVGDAPHDTAAGRAAGTRAVGLAVRPRGWGPVDAVVPDLWALAAWLRTVDLSAP